MSGESMPTGFSASRVTLVFILVGVLLSAMTLRAAGMRAPAGSFPIVLRAGADTAVGMPLERPAIFVSRLASVDGETLTVAAEPDWGVDSLAGADGEYFYCQVFSGDLRGTIFTITGNGSRSLTVAAAGEDLARLATNALDGDGLGDQIRIVPCWTPETVFAHTPAPVGTTIYVYDCGRVGLNKAPSAAFQATADGWVDADGHSGDTFPLRRGHGFFVRLPETSEDQVLTVVGCVPTIPERFVFEGTCVEDGADVLFGLANPEPLAIAAAGLEFGNRTQVFEFRGDRENGRRPSRVRTYHEGYGWFDEVYRRADESVELVPGYSYLVRIPATAVATQWIWEREPGYLSAL